MLTVNKHKIQLTKILLSLYSNSAAASTLGFKGGTAAYLFYGLPRFSVDLDFDLIYQDKPFSETYLNSLFDKITDILSKGYELRDQSLKFNTLFWLVSYERGEQQIKVEVSTRKIPNTFNGINYYGVNLPVLCLGDMIAHKLIAIQERKVLANRDLFDAHYFLNMREADAINYEIIKLITGKSPHQFYSSLLEFLKTVNSERILTGLGELLDNKQKDWVKVRLLEELTNKVRYFRDMFEE